MDVGHVPRLVLLGWPKGQFCSGLSVLCARVVPSLYMASLGTVNPFENTQNSPRADCWQQESFNMY